MSAHSDKALKTMELMGTTADRWAVPEIRWVKEERMVPGYVTCPTCNGTKWVKYDAAGKALPVPKATGGFGCPRDTYYREARKEAGGGYHGNCKTCRNTNPRARAYGCSEGTIKGEVLALVMVGYPQWTAGVRFDSRFRGGMSCGLCNKTVLKSNLVPVEATGADGRVHGMWVGSDCAKKFLAVKPEKTDAGEKFYAAE